MARPRKKGGTISPVASGGHRLTITMTVAGESIRKEFRGTSKAAVLRKRDDWLEINGLGLDDGPPSPAPAAGGMPTLHEWMRVLDEEYVKRGRSDATRAAAASQYRNHIQPLLGERRLDAITPEDVAQLHRQAAAKGLATSSVVSVHKFLSRALTLACTRGVLMQNVARMVQPPAVKEVSPEPFTDDELRAVVEVARKDPQAVRWMTTLMTGARKAEVLGLCWDSVDFDRGALVIRRTLTRQVWQHGCGATLIASEAGHSPSKCPQRIRGQMFGRTKTSGSVRVIAIAPELVDMLRAHKSSQDAWFKMFGRRPETGQEFGGLVFLSSAGTRIDHRGDDRHWLKLFQRAGVDLKGQHASRHTIATQMLEEGVDTRVVADAMGWASTRMAMRYQHVGESLSREASNAISSRWGGIFGNDDDKVVALDRSQRPG